MKEEGKMRFLGLLVIILGIAAIVFGIMFIPQASDAKQKVVDSLSTGITLDNLDDTYDAVSAQFKAMAQTDPMYIPTLAKRTSLGLAKSNVGLAKLINTMGMVNIIVGAGLLLAGCAVMMKKNQAA
jgi:outer membrane murein-binding lipoprotein Lpp